MDVTFHNGQYRPTIVIDARRSYLIHERETDTVKAVLTRDGDWYYLNAYARRERRESFVQVYNSRIYLSYMAALHAYNDDAGMIRQFGNLLVRS